MKELRRSATDCKLFGVCGGLAEYFNIEKTTVYKRKNRALDRLTVLLFGKV